MYIIIVIINFNFRHDSPSHTNQARTFIRKVHYKTICENINDDSNNNNNNSHLHFHTNWRILLFFVRWYNYLIINRISLRLEGRRCINHPVLWDLPVGAKGAGLRWGRDIRRVFYIPCIIIIHKMIKVLSEFPYP